MEGERTPGTVLWEHRTLDFVMAPGGTAGSWVAPGASDHGWGEVCLRKAGVHHSGEGWARSCPDRVAAGTEVWTGPQGMWDQGQRPLGWTKAHEPIRPTSGTLQSGSLEGAREARERSPVGLSAASGPLCGSSGRRQGHSVDSAGCRGRSPLPRGHVGCEQVGGCPEGQE